jgi:hypothetical protein
MYLPTFRRSRDFDTRSDGFDPACGFPVSAIWLLAIYLNGTLAKVMLSATLLVLFLGKEDVSKGGRMICFHNPGQCIYSDMSGKNDGFLAPLQSSSLMLVLFASRTLSP